MAYRIRRELGVDAGTMGHMAISTRRIRPDDGALLREVRLAALLDTPSAFASTHGAESQNSDER